MTKETIFICDNCGHKQADIYSWQVRVTCGSLEKHCFDFCDKCKEDIFPSGVFPTPEHKNKALSLLKKWFKQND